MKILIKNARIIDPVNNLDKIYDLLLVDNKISKIHKEISEDKADQVYNLENMIVIPGLIDMHTHLREPGFEEKETIKSGCEAAAAGGFTTIASMPNTNPVVDNPASVEYIKSKAEKAVVKVKPIGSITKKSQGEELAEIGFLARAGVVGLSDDGQPVMNSEIMRRAMEYAGSFDLPIISHCEDINLVGNGVMNEGYNSTILGLKPIPPAAEEIMISRDIILAEYTGCRLHIAHLSTAKGMEMVAKARQKGIHVTAEVTPHHLLLSDEKVKGYNPDTKVNPPLRSSENLKELQQGLKDGIIDAVATDHAPHTFEDKLGEYNYAASGISGLETALSLIYNNFVKREFFDWKHLIRIMAVNPADILGIDYQGIKEGAAADLVVFDPQQKWIVDKNKFKSMGKNTPFDRCELTGKIKMTFVEGNVVYNNLAGTGEIIYA